uniref:Predicted 3'-5' exonuclease PolB-like domain-containing protein n=1 Tax=candidate division WOR-3 bacterium TaxID=2052148 RepID=A0A7C3N8Q6_UNCW3
MGEICFDIETLGIDDENLDQKVLEYFVNREEGFKEKKGLYPFSGKIIAISVLDIDKKLIETFYHSSQVSLFDTGFVDDYSGFKRVFIVCDEKGIIKNFYDRVKNASRFITFNGLRFDCPFITFRAIINGITPTRNINTPRFKKEEHYDIYDVLTLSGLIKGNSLDIYCKVFDIPSPKVNISGKDVEKFYREEKFLEIAKYCSLDVYSTFLLYQKIKDYF